MDASLDRAVEAPSHARIPPRGGWPSHPPPPPVGFTSIVGALTDLAAIAQQWENRAGPLLGALRPPRVLLNPGERDVLQSEPTGLRVAVVEHPAGLVGAIAPALREFASAYARGQVDVDPGYWLAPAMRGAPPAPQNSAAPAWTTRWNLSHYSALRNFATPVLPSTVVGSSAVRDAWTARRRRVLLIDTGDQRAVRQDAFLISRIDVPDHPPLDWHGHGTSLGDVIRLRAPAATVLALRVFERGAAYSASPALLAALTWALHPVAGADIVCIAQRAEVSADHAEHAAVIMSILRHAVAGGVAMPVVVCAAGNSRRRRQDLMALPATAPGVLVARAVDWRGNPLEYNCRPPRGAALNMVGAYGGEENDLIGVTEAPTQPEVRMIGSSYAAALVAGALAAD